MINYRPYLLQKPLTINNRNFNEIIISSHYEENHSFYMTDEKILEIVRKLNGEIMKSEPKKKPT